MPKTIPVPFSGGLILSYKCSAECLHCMYGCSPKWTDDWISDELLTGMLGQLAGKIKPSPYGPENISLNHGLHFTGGEPFLNFELLGRAVEFAHKLRIPSLFVETNCYWCTSDKTTREKMQYLKAKGMRGLMISVNPFYLEYVPFERTERGVRIGLEVFDQNVAVYQLEYYQRFKNWGVKDRVAFRNYLHLEPKENFLRNVEFFLMGRAVYKLGRKLRGFFPRYPARHWLGLPCMPPFLRNWHNHFDNYGNYIPGYCGGISFGDCRHLDVLLTRGLDAGEYPVLSFLMDEDLEGLCHLARAFGYRESREGYFSRCHLCIDVRKHLAKEKKFDELTPLEFYQHLG